MKKIFKFGCLGVIVIVIIAVIAGIAGTGGNDTQNAPTTHETGTKTSTPAPAKQQAPQAKIGSVLPVGNVEFTVNSKSEATNVGGQFGKTAQGKYLILNVTVTNKGDKAITVDSNFFKLKADGKEYEADGSATIFANENANFFLSQVNPDVSIKGNVVFDVPAELLQKNLVLNVQTGVFGTEQGQIELK